MLVLFGENVGAVICSQADLSDGERCQHICKPTHRHFVVDDASVQQARRLGTCMGNTVDIASIVYNKTTFQTIPVACTIAENQMARSHGSR